MANEARDTPLRPGVPIPWALYAVMVINVAVWAAHVFSGMSPMAPAPAALFAWGANSATAVVRDGEYWRLLTATALHGGVLHLGLNMFALWDAGRRVCLWFGNGQFLLVYLCAGLAGSALSLHFSSQQAVSVGASGAVFGVLGALSVSLLRHRASLPRAMARQLLISQTMFIALMLAQGFVLQGIDNAAHIGGLLAGGAVGGLLVESFVPKASAARRRGRQALAVGMVALLVSGLTATARPGVDHAQLFFTQAALTQIMPRLRAAERALQADIDAQKNGRLSQAGFIEALEQRHLSAYREIDASLKSLDSTQLTPVLDDLVEFHATMLEIMTLEVAQYRRTVPSAETGVRLKALSAQLQALGAQLRSAGSEEARPEPSGAQRP
jgi:rhomboid protease GluP